MPIIIPALLTDNLDDLKKKLAVVNDFAEWIQIDITDGQFVPSHSLQLEKIISVSHKPQAEIHLMVANPLDYLNNCQLAKVQIVLFHLESSVDPQKIIVECLQKGLKVGIVLNPETPINQALLFDGEVDTVQLMGVYPGYYGRPLVPDTTLRLKKLRGQLKHAMLEVDGGVNEDNIVEIAATGVDRIVVGSAVFGSHDPPETFQGLNDLVNN